MTRFYFIIFFLLNGFFVLFAQSADNQLRERAYVQTDKQIYLAGEMVWLKFSTTTVDGVPLCFSKVGYVELLANDGIKSQVKVEVENGNGSGCFTIPVELTTGYYKLVGYTRYMQNEGEKVYFEKNIGVINTFQPARINTTDNALSGAREKFAFSPQQRSINILLDKAVYSTREEVEVTLNNIPEDIFSLSVSVAGRDLVANGNQTNILKWQERLTSLSLPVFSNEFIPEYEGNIITGKLVDIETGEVGKSEDVSAYLAFPGDKIRLFGGKSDSAGHIMFVTKRISGLQQVATTINPASAQQHYRVDLQSPFSEHTYDFVLPPLNLKEEWHNDLLMRSVGLQSLYAFNENLLDKNDTIASSYFRWQPSQRYILDKYKRFPTMEETIVEIVSYLRFRRIDGKRYISVFVDEKSGFSTENTLVMLDGVPVWNHDDIFTYNPDFIEYIDIYRNSFVFGGNGNSFGAIVNFVSKSKDMPSYKMDINSQLLNYNTPQVKRFFYVPDYSDPEARQSTLPDFRHTLLWIPELNDVKTPSASFSFSTSDLTGEFVITVEGFTRDGKPVYAQDLFTVK